MLDKLKSIFSVDPKKLKEELDRDPNHRRRKAEAKSFKRSGHALSPDEIKNLKFQDRVLRETKDS